MNPHTCVRVAHMHLRGARQKLQKLKISVGFLTIRKILIHYTNRHYTSSPMSTLNQDEALMRKIDHAATLEKASKVQFERGLHLYNAKLSADQETQFFLESNKEKASSIHVDVRGASTQLSNRLNKNITILETRRLKLRRNESGQKISNNTTIKAINELRLEKLSFDRIFGKCGAMSASWISIRFDRCRHLLCFPWHMPCCQFDSQHQGDHIDVNKVDHH